MLYVPYQQQQTHGPHLAQIQPPDTPRRLPRPRPPHALPHDERQVDAQAQQAKDAPVHARQVAGVALPGSKTSVVRNQGDGPRRADDGAKHVAEEDLDEGGGLVAASDLLGDAAAGEDLAGKEGCTGKWNMAKGPADRKDRERWWHTERPRWREVQLAA